MWNWRYSTHLLNWNNHPYWQIGRFWELRVLTYQWLNNLHDSQTRCKWITWMNGNNTVDGSPVWLPFYKGVCICRTLSCEETRCDLINCRFRRCAFVSLSHTAFHWRLTQHILQQGNNPSSNLETTSGKTTRWWFHLQKAVDLHFSWFILFDSSAPPSRIIALCRDASTRHLGG